MRKEEIPQNFFTHPTAHGNFIQPFPDVLRTLFRIRAKRLFQRLCVIDSHAIADRSILKLDDRFGFGLPV